jgi:hypothetical protein
MGAPPAVSVAHTTEPMMKKMIAVLVLCIVSAMPMTTATASAQGAPPPAGTPRAAHAMQQLQARFARANTTGDGKLTRAQAVAGMPVVARYFDEIDTQHVGYVTVQQIAERMQKGAMTR